MDKQNFLGDNHPEYNGRFPISADTFDFMQNQIEFVSQLASAFGYNVLLKRPTSARAGLIVLNGELLPLRAGTSTGSKYNIVEETESVTAQGSEYDEARKIRYAIRSSNTTDETVNVSNVVDLTGRSENSETLANQFLPKGAIIMWSGSTSNLPKGFHLCDGSTVNDVVCPDLRGRFIAGYKRGDTEFGTIGNTGGEKTQTLDLDNIPKHRHEVLLPSDKTDGEAAIVRRGFSDYLPKIGSWSGYAGKENPDAFSVLPPYYVLAYIIKVI